MFCNFVTEKNKIFINIKKYYIQMATLDDFYGFLHTQAKYRKIKK